MKKPCVTLIDQPGYHIESIRGAVRQTMQDDALDVAGKVVFVKPSFVYPARPPKKRAVNTQPEVVLGTVRALIDLGAYRVLVGEDCLVGPSENAFVGMGILEELRSLAEPIFLRQDRRVQVQVDHALIEDRFAMPKTLMDADVFVTLPKLKVNMYATVTLSVKNHVGLLLQADRLTNHHYHIHRKIADLYRARIPDYIITDAIEAGEGQGPMHAISVPLHLLIASKNGVAADVVACHLSGFDPVGEVEHLRYLHELRLGPIDLDLIDIRNRSYLEQRKKKFVRPHTDLREFQQSIRLYQGSEFACSEGCLGMIQGSLDRFCGHQMRDLTFLVGKPLPKEMHCASKLHTFVVGDCAKQYQHLGTFIPGCPPHPMALTWALLRRGINGPMDTRIRDLAVGTLINLFDRIGR